MHVKLLNTSRKCLCVQTCNIHVTHKVHMKLLHIRHERLYMLANYRRATFTVYLNVHGRAMQAVQKKSHVDVHARSTHESVISLSCT